MILTDLQLGQTAKIININALEPVLRKKLLKWEIQLPLDVQIVR